MNGDDGDNRGRTRLQTATNRLNLPGLGRGISRSPSPAVAGAGRFAFPTVGANQDDSSEAFADGESYADAMPPIDVEELQRIAKSAADAAAVASAALTAMTAQLQATQEANTQLRATKKPELPNFDAKNIEIWIRRVESSFTRAGITTTKDKFAFLEAKLSVDLDARINSFLFGTITETTWTEFTAYLVKRYGRTKQQRTNTLIDGIQREGRRPSELAAILCDLTRDVTIEDIRKEQLMKVLPEDVKRALAKEPDNLSLEQLAEAADAYFDQQGRPKFSTPSSTINAVNDSTLRSSCHPNNPTTTPHDAGATPSFTNAFGEGVNAVRRPLPTQASGAAKPAPRSNASSSRANQHQPNQTRPPTYDSEGFYHATYGVKADRCFPGCKHPSAHTSGNDRGGRRK